MQEDTEQQEVSEAAMQSALALMPCVDHAEEGGTHALLRGLTFARCSVTEAARQSVLATDA